MGELSNKVLISKEKLINIANAIRYQLETDRKYTLDEIAEAILRFWTGRIKLEDEIDKNSFTIQNIQLLIDQILSDEVQVKTILPKKSILEDEINLINFEIPEICLFSNFEGSVESSINNIEN